MSTTNGSTEQAMPTTTKGSDTQRIRDAQRAAERQVGKPNMAPSDVIELLRTKIAEHYGIGYSQRHMIPEAMLLVPAYCVQYKVYTAAEKAVILIESIASVKARIDGGEKGLTQKIDSLNKTLASVQAMADADAVKIAANPNADPTIIIDSVADVDRWSFWRAVQMATLAASHGRRYDEEKKTWILDYESLWSIDSIVAALLLRESNVAHDMMRGMVRTARKQGNKTAIDGYMTASNEDVKRLYTASARESAILSAWCGVRAAFDSLLRIVALEDKANHAKDEDKRAAWNAALDGFKNADGTLKLDESGKVIEAGERARFATLLDAIDRPWDVKAAVKADETTVKADETTVKA